MKQVATMVCNGRYTVIFDGTFYKVIHKWRELREDGVHDRSKTIVNAVTLPLAMSCLYKIAYKEWRKEYFG